MARHKFEYHTVECGDPAGTYARYNYEDTLELRPVYHTILIPGQLPSFRSKGLNTSQNKIAAGAALFKVQQSWYMDLISVNAKEHLRKLQLYATLNGVKVRILVDVVRKIPIRDYKNLVAGFDHVILDSLVRANILWNDQMSNIELSVGQRGIDEDYPKEMVFMRFDLSKEPCGPTEKKRLMERKIALLDNTIPVGNKLKDAKRRMRPLTLADFETD
jgi:hypothetical protein